MSIWMGRKGVLGAGAGAGGRSVPGQKPMSTTQDTYAQRHARQFGSGLSEDNHPLGFLMGGREKVRNGPVDTYTLLPQPTQPSRGALASKRLPSTMAKAHSAPYARDDHLNEGYGTMGSAKDNASTSRASSANSSYLQKRAELVGKRFVGGSRNLSGGGGTGADPVPAAAPTATAMVQDRMQEDTGTILVRSAGSRATSASAGFANAAAVGPPAGYMPLAGGGLGSGSVGPVEHHSESNSGYLPAVGTGSSASNYGSIWGVPRMLTQLLKGGINRSSTTPRTAAAPVPIGGATVDLDQLTGNNSLEVFQQMRRDESRNHVYEPDTAYLEHRRKLVGWMAEVGVKLKMRPTTAHVGICFLDRIFQRRLPTREKWHMLAVSCLQVAAKYEEAEENVPAVTQLTRASGIQLTVQTVQKWEVAALEGLGWALTCIVPLHFLEYYHSRGVLFYGDFAQGKALTVKSQVVPQQMRKYTQWFANYIMVQEYSFRKYAPSYLAAVIIYTSRYAMSVNPVWRQELTDLTGYDESSIYSCFHQLWRSYREEYPGAGVTTSFGSIPDPPVFENSPRR